MSALSRKYEIIVHKNTGLEAYYKIVGILNLCPLFCIFSYHLIHKLTNDRSFWLVLYHVIKKTITTVIG